MEDRRSLFERLAEQIAPGGCLVIGSTLVVYPAAYMPAYAVRSGAKLAIINLSETPMDTQADILINGKAGEIMSAVMAKIRELNG